MPADPARDEALTPTPPAPSAPPPEGEVPVWRLVGHPVDSWTGRDPTASGRPAMPPRNPAVPYVAIPRAQRERERAVLDAADAYVHAKGAPERARTGIALGEAVAALRGKGGGASRVAPKGGA